MQLCCSEVRCCGQAGVYITKFQFTIQAAQNPNCGLVYVSFLCLQILEFPQVNKSEVKCIILLQVASFCLCATFDRTLKKSYVYKC